MLKETFALPDSEVLVQNYFCTCGMTPGNMYLTPNYCLFVSNLGASGNVKTPFTTVKSVEKSKSLLGSSVRVATESGTHTFSRFVHFDEAFELVNYMYAHPQVVVKLGTGLSGAGFAEPRSFGTAVSHATQGSSFTDSRQLQQAALGTQGTGFAVGASVPSSGGGYSGGGYSGGYGGAMQQQAQGQVQVAPVTVDLESSAAAVRRLQNARQYGMDAMGELAYQGDVLNGIENNIESIHHSLGQANQHISGIDSFSGQLRNKLLFDPTAAYERQEFSRGVVNALEQTGPEVLSVLRKREDTSLVPATLTLLAAEFCVHDGKDARDYRYRYADVKCAVVRNRALHLDLRFRDGKRERVVSAYTQQIVNEMALRGECEVFFETNAPPFEYGSPELRTCLNKRAQLARASEGLGGAAGFLRRGTAQTSYDVQTASDRYRADLVRQEQHVDQINDLLGDLHYMTSAIGVTVDAQNDQLARINARTDQAIAGLQTTNRRLDESARKI